MPERRCVGCDRVAPKRDLVRLALEPPAREAGPSRRPPSRALESEHGALRRVVVDARGELPGRGGYLCVGDRPGVPDPACLERALRRGGLSRAFRTPVTMHPDFVESTC